MKGYEYKTNKKNNNKAITLIALVITIIVLLILAGVSIIALTGDNGILGQASKAKTATEENAVKEEIKLAYNAIQIEGYGKGWNLDRRAEELQNELQRADISASVSVSGEDLIVNYKGYKTTIKVDGTLGELAKSDIIIKNFSIKGTPAETVPVPEGFYHVGGTVDEGYVISDNEEDEGAGVDAELKGNQFVWVPVEKDQKIKISVSSKDDITSIVLTDPYGDDLAIPAVSGKEYNEEITPTINGPYRLVITTAKGTEKRFLNVHSLYAVDTFRDFEATEEYAKANGFDDLQHMLNSRYPSDGYGPGATIEKLLMDGSFMKDYTETEDYTAKVNTNGGFYIARYEATYEKVDKVEKVASKKATSRRTESSITLQNGMLWNCISQTDALSKAKVYNTSISSTLPTGAAWDRVMGWLYEKKEKTGVEIAEDSRSWGNYGDDTFSNTTGLIKPGQFKETEANNIYDLAGNVQEWTTESHGSTTRVLRGGLYTISGHNYPASNRYYVDSENSNISFGLRLTLFL